MRSRIISRVKLSCICNQRSHLLQLHHPSIQYPTATASCVSKKNISALLLSPLWSAGEQRLIFMLLCESCSMLVQSAVRDPRHWSNGELHWVLHFHVNHCCSDTLLTSISILCRCCGVNMWTERLHAFWWLLNSAMAGLWLWLLFYLRQL